MMKKQNELKSETVSIRISQNLKEKLERFANESCMSITAYVKQAIEDKIYGNNNNADTARYLGMLLNSIRELSDFDDNDAKKKCRQAVYYIEDQIAKNHKEAVR